MTDITGVLQISGWGKEKKGMCTNLIHNTQGLRYVQGDSVGETQSISSLMFL